MKELLKAIARAVFPDYQLIRIYFVDTKIKTVELGDHRLRLGRIADETLVIREADDRDLQDHAWYAGKDATGFGLWEEGRLVCTCWIWTHNHPQLPKRFARLGTDEEVLMDIITARSSRGKGYAPILISHTESEMKKQGCGRLWAWIWHSNEPSIRSFTKANWTYSHFLVELKVRGF